MVERWIGAQRQPTCLNDESEQAGWQRLLTGCRPLTVNAR